MAPPGRQSLLPIPCLSHLALRSFALLATGTCSPHLWTSGLHQTPQEGAWSPEPWREVSEHQDPDPDVGSERGGAWSL